MPAACLAACLDAHPAAAATAWAASSGRALPLHPMALAAAESSDAIRIRIAPHMQQLLAANPAAAGAGDLNGRAPIAALDAAPTGVSTMLAAAGLAPVAASA